MVVCARCGNTKTSPLSECVHCQALDAARSGYASPPKRCPDCGADVPGPPDLGKLSCPACARVFPDYESWVIQCRAAAYAAHPAPAVSTAFKPGPPPPHLRAVALGFLVAAPLQAIAGAVAPDVLLPCLLLAALQTAAGLALLKEARHADRLARWAAGLSALVPVLLLPAFFFMWVFRYFTQPAATSHYGPPPEPASPTARARVLAGLFLLAVAGLLIHAFLVTPALREAYAWQEPLAGSLAAAHDILHFYWRHSAWIILGGVAGFYVLERLGRIRARAFFQAAGLAAAALLLFGPAPGAAAAAFEQAAAKAREVERESDLTRLLWALKEPDPKSRIAAARRLARLGREVRTSVPALEKALGDRDARVRASAALALAAVDPRSDRAVTELIAALSRPRGPLWDLEAFTSALLQFGPRARPALPLLLAGLAGSPAAVPLLAEIGAPAVPGLIDILRRPEPDARRRALEVLRRIGPAARGASTAVEAALQDRDPRVREAAVLAFGEIQREKAVPPLYDLVCGDSPLKPAAAEALSSLGEKDALIGHPRPGNHLNALRRPAQWDHLRRLPIDHDMAGTAGEVLEELAVQAVMCVEASPAVRAELAPYRRFYGASRKRSGLEVLQALDLNFVLEEDRIRILSSAQASEFWTKWLYETLANR